MPDSEGTVFVVGLGLIGGSLAMALRQTGRYHVIGHDADYMSMQAAAEAGAVDSFAESLDPAAAASIVVVATPLLAMPSVFDRLSRQIRARPCAPARTVVTDVGSAKAYVMHLAEEYFSPDISFIGGHPMAGNERSGIHAAYPSLFSGSTVAITPAPWTDAEPGQEVFRLWQSVGAKPMAIEAVDHDAMVAMTSHLPLVLSACLANVVGRRSLSMEGIWQMAAGGFRDSTRLASGDTVMGTGMLLANAEEVSKAIAEFKVELDQALAGIAAGDHGLVQGLLTQARSFRKSWLNRKDDDA